jgi:hypothetical protein
LIRPFRHPLPVARDRVSASEGSAEAGFPATEVVGGSRGVGGVFGDVERLYRWGTAFAPAKDSVAGRLPFPPPPRPLAVTGPVLEVFPGLSPSRARWVSLARRLRLSRFTPRDLPLSFRALSLCQDSSRPPKRSESFLSWDSPACAPLPFVFRRVHSRKLALPSVRRCDPSNHVPPSWFRTTSAVFSASALRVCCTPLPALGFDAFSGGLPVTRRFLGGGPVPAPRIHPTKSSPRQQPFPHFCVRFLPAVTVHPPGPTVPVARVFDGRREQVRWRPSPPVRRLAPCPCGPPSFRRRRAESEPPGIECRASSRSAVAEAIVPGGRSRRKPRGYLPSQPKLMRNLSRPKPEGALSGGPVAQPPKWMGLPVARAGARCISTGAGSRLPTEVGPSRRTVSRV